MRLNAPVTFRYARHLWQYELTPAGRFLFWTVLFTSVGMTTVMIPVYQIFAVLFAAYVVVWITNLLYRPTLNVTGRLPGRITAGELLRTEIQLTNISWRPAYDLMLWLVRLPRSWHFESGDLVIPRLGPGETGKLPLILRPSQRGIYELPDLRPHSTFPFNLMRSGSLRVPLGTVTVTPKFHRIGTLDIPVGLNYQPGGVALTSNIGESPEYIGNREYQPGEPVRRLDFRGWARLAKPVVREYHEEYYCRIALILDTYIPARRRAHQPFPQLEAAVSLAASIADALSATEHLIDIFAAGPQLYVFRAGRNLAHLDHVLEILAAVERCPSNPFEVIAPAVAQELSSITTAVCILLDWDAARENLTRAITEAGCQLKLIIVRDGPTSLALPCDLGEIVCLTTQQVDSGGIDVL